MIVCGNGCGAEKNPAGGPPKGGLHVCLKDYGGKCRFDAKGYRCVGCAWVCTDCLVKLSRERHRYGRCRVCANGKEAAYA